jgi:SAM-dependent methyltransferase
MALDYVQSDRERRAEGHHLLMVTGCQRCGTIFINPPPSEEVLAQTYDPQGRWNQAKNADVVERTSGDEYDKEEEAADQGGGAGPQKMVREIVEQVKQAFSRPFSELKVFDFGCGRGFHLDLLADKGFQTFGADPATKPFIVRHKMLDAPPATPTFDIVIVNHVIEHMRNPLAILRQLRACTKADGLLVFGVPALDDLSRHRKHRYCVNASHHITAYTKRSISALLAEAGFEVSSIRATTKGFRMRGYARPAAAPKKPNMPLWDAYWEFRRYRRALLQEQGAPGWRALIEPVRRTALRENQRQEAAAMERRAQLATKQATKKKKDARRQTAKRVSKAAPPSG